MVGSKLQTRGASRDSYLGKLRCAVHSYGSTADAAEPPSQLSFATSPRAREASKSLSEIRLPPHADTSEVCAKKTEASVAQSSKCRLTASWTATGLPQERQQEEEHRQDLAGLSIREHLHEAHKATRLRIDALWL